MMMMSIIIKMPKWRLCVSVFAAAAGREKTKLWEIVHLVFLRYRYFRDVLYF